MNPEMLSEIVETARPGSAEEEMISNIVRAFSIHEEMGYSPDRLIVHPIFHAGLRRHLGRIKIMDFRRFGIQINRNARFEKIHFLGMRIETNPYLKVPFRIADERGHPRQSLKFLKEGFCRESRHA